MTIALVAGAIGWVGWNCIDSVQKNAGKLHNYNVTADNTRIDSHHYDIVKNEVDKRVFTEPLSPSQDLTYALVKQEGSELFWSKGLAAMDEHKLAPAAAAFSRVLTMIPGEAKKKTTWFVSGETIDRLSYTQRAYFRLYNCYRLMGDYARAAAVVTEAIKLTPGIAGNYQSRAALYYRLGKKALGDADMKTARALSRHQL